MPWFKGWIKEINEGRTVCKTFLEILDVIIQLRRFVDKPLRLSVQDIYKVSGIGTVVVGRVDTGVLKVGMPICFAPSNLTSTVRSIEMQYTNLQEALSGNIVGFNVGKIRAKELRRGLICSDTKNDPAREAASFIALIAMLNSPSEIELGDKLMVYCHTARITCQLVEFLEKIDYQTGETIEASSKFIKSGDLATVKLVLLQPACVENFQEYPSLGHFTIRQMNHTVAVGITKDVENMTTVSYDNPTSNIDMYY
ncbi:unnamed protein product [Rotaria magnacalcarata]|uniref:Translation elongation factor EFTu-like domain-containing protein n=1 Tax=Rotaria magnacalcarata TaxID=392030 RepID=A0A816TIV1_9BILA|nr:unnamed protein product [Rotaria magnacalcarata]CAF4006704.1 unnamed protein product [Rotaria magnacalcarata]